MNLVEAPEARVRPEARRLARPGDMPAAGAATAFSADNHISISEDIFYERVPAAMKHRAPRIWFDDGMYHIGFDGQSLLRPRYRPSMRMFDEVPGSASSALDERL